MQQERAWHQLGMQPCHQPSSCDALLCYHHVPISSHAGCRNGLQGWSASLSDGECRQVVCPLSCCNALQVILLQDIEKLGKQGELLTVPVGFWRNFLLPQGQAKVASQQILE